jgi:hypothetical protein
MVGYNNDVIDATDDIIHSDGDLKAEGKNKL